MLTPSDDQNKAVEAFETFINNDSQVLIITGTAGSGKTSLIKPFAKVAKLNGWRFTPLGVWSRSSAAITQVTGLIAIHIAQYLRVNEAILEYGEEYEFESFHKYFTSLHNRIFPALGDAVREFFRFGDDISFKGDVLVVDEASCLSPDELTDFTNFAINNSEEDIKIVFIGDPCQIPPVKSKDSFALNETYFEKSLGLVVEDSIELITSHRSSKGPLYELAKELRKLACDDATGEEARRLIKSHINNEEVLGFGEVAVLNKAKEHLEKDPDEVIFLAPTNNETLPWAKKLRNLIFVEDDEKNEIINPGERLRASFTGEEGIVLKGDEFKVLEILDSTDSFTIVKVEEIGRRQEWSFSLRAFASSFKSLIDKNFSSLADNKQFNLAIYTPTLISDEKTYGGGGIKNVWEDQINNLNNNIQVRDIVNCIYSYSSTIHLSQGGEWNNVILKMDDPWEGNDTAKLWYTAVTRAKERIYIIL